MTESEKEFGKRFNKLFSNHVDTLVKKDFPVLIAHMNEDGKCEECVVSDGCEIFREGLLKLIDELPSCIRKKLKKT